MKMKNRARACLLLPLLTLLGCLCAGHARAQSVPVTLHATDTALEQVLDQIERQTISRARTFPSTLVLHLKRTSGSSGVAL